MVGLSQECFLVMYIFLYFCHPIYGIMNEVQNQVKLPLSNLERKKERREIRLNAGFFSSFDNPDILDAHANVVLEAKEVAGTVSVVMSFEGEITVPCDRCLEDLAVSVKGENTLLLRFGKEEEPDGYEYEDEDVMYVNRDADEADLTVYVYESLCLALPMQRVHGDDDDGNSLCNPEMMKYIKVS
jgi:uncharacterized metal-binding protein YceD (DUF177 family)